jgi:hypothetical protein
MAGQTSNILLCTMDSVLLRAMARAAGPIFQLLETPDSRMAFDCLLDPQLEVVATDQLPLLAEARRVRPDVRRVLLTDYSNLGEVVRGLHDTTIQQVVDKPLKEREFLAAIAPPPRREPVAA